MSLIATIDRLCKARIGRTPNWANPTGYNDLIQWLKVYDQRPYHPICCDKLAVRKWVAGIAGPEVLIPVLAVGANPEALKLRERRSALVVKCTHDSGSAMLVDDAAKIPVIEQRLRKHLSRSYGAEKGEWAYARVPRRVMAEFALPSPVVDYKFHCAHGWPRWVQVIRERDSGKPRETILAPDGKRMALHMDHKMAHDPDAAVYPGDEAWAELSMLARQLAHGWRYVRVDLYWSEGKALFGELTFWPLSGCYKTADEPTFGKMLALDLSHRFPPLVT